MSDDANKTLLTAAEIVAQTSGDETPAPAPAGTGIVGDGSFAAGKPRPEPEPAPQKVFVDTTRGDALPLTTRVPLDANSPYTLIKLKGLALFFNGERILQPASQADVRKLLADHDEELLDLDEIAHFQNLQANYDRLAKHISDRTDRAVRDQIQKARGDLSREGTDEAIGNYEGLSHSKEYLQSRNREVRSALKEAMQTFDRNYVHPAVAVILQRAGEKILPIIELQTETEKHHCERAGLPFTQSPCLLTLKFAVAKLCDRASAPAPAVYPPSPRSQLSIVFDLPAAS